MKDVINFCPDCGKKTIKKFEGKKRRDFCVNCNRFFYNNPLVAVAAVCFIDDGIVFVKRKYNPCKGLWTLPGGFVETGETTEAALKRELKEETGLVAKKVEFIKVMTVRTGIFKTLVLIGYKVTLKKGKLTAGDDAADVKVIKINKLPVITFSAHKILINEALKM
jgi:ADP-ribose pyrophosphatase YjhB (NUDIX family)